MRISLSVGSRASPPPPPFACAPLQRPVSGIGNIDFRFQRRQHTIAGSQQIAAAAEIVKRQQARLSPRFGAPHRPSSAAPPAYRRRWRWPSSCRQAVRRAIRPASWRAAPGHLKSRCRGRLKAKVFCQRKTAWHFARPSESARYVVKQFKRLGKQRAQREPVELRFASSSGARNCSI